MRSVIIFFMIATSFQSTIFCNPVRGWNILSDNLQCAERAIKSAKKYKINHLQLSHHLIHNIKEVSDESKLKKIKYVISLAHDAGIDKVFIWDHALYEKEYYPKKFFTENGNQLNLDDENLWDWIKKDYIKNLEKVNQIDGVVLTFIETGLRIENQYSKLYPTATDKYVKLIKELNSVFHRHFNIDLVLRTFSYNNKELNNILDAINSINFSNSYIMIKESNHDFFITHPPNSLITKINKDHRVIIEFDAAHEYSGQGVVASIFPDFHFKRANFFSKFKNVVGYAIRTDRYGDTSVLGTPCEINLFALEKGFDNSEASHVDVINKFISNNYTEKLVPRLYKIFDEADDIIMSSFYTLGLNTERHSTLNFDYRSIYTRHVSGRWLDDPVIIIESGLNKKYHYWKDVVNHLSPSRHKTGDGFYKLRSSPTDSISYKKLNELEISEVIDNKWLEPCEMMNEEYLNDIIIEKKFSIAKAEELLNLVSTLKTSLTKKQYETFKGIFERTLLATKLRASIAVVYYGSRIELKSRDLKMIIDDNRSKARAIISEIENYNHIYPIGEYNWKLDGEIAKKYLLKY